MKPKKAPGRNQGRRENRRPKKRRKEARAPAPEGTKGSKASLLQKRPFAERRDLKDKRSSLKGGKDLRGKARRRSKSEGIVESASAAAPRLFHKITDKLTGKNRPPAEGAEKPPRSKARNPARSRNRGDGLPRRRFEGEKGFASRPHRGGKIKDKPARSAEGYSAKKGRRRFGDEKSEKSAAPSPPRRRFRDAATQAFSAFLPFKKQVPALVTGVVKRHPGGFGFVIPDIKGTADIYIPHSKMGSALTDDRVEVRLDDPKRSPPPSGDRRRSPGGAEGGERGRRFAARRQPFGSIAAVLERRKRIVSGLCEEEEGSGGPKILKSHGLGVLRPLTLCNPSKIPVQQGDWVRAEITHYPDGSADSAFKAAIVGNLGRIRMEAADDGARVLAKHSIALSFPEEAQAEAEKMPDEVSEKDFEGRRDLRSKPFVTIDGATAKDFDDSVFAEVLPEGGFRLWTAIADVSHYIKEGSPLDREAFSRGNSVYLPDLVSPMLPKKLSDGLCSLNPHVPRLCLTAEMDFDSSGEMIRSSFYEAVIESRRRLTYAETQEMTDSKAFSGDLSFLQTAVKLAEILIEKDAKDGALDFNLTDTVIKTDGKGVPLDVMRGRRLFAHRLIEQFMLAANKAAARFLEKRGRALVYRVHDSPDREKLLRLEIFARSLGFDEPLHSRKNLLKLLKRFKGNPKEPLINKLTLRAMAQACYSARNKGHYGLHAPCYTHFTSPIRRYCDLMVHRELKKALAADKLQPSKEARRRPASKKELEEKSALISAREQAAVKAEREVCDIKKARFLKGRVGEEFEGTISSVTAFGFFIALKDYDIEGLVRFRDLPGHWVWDEERLCASAKRSGYIVGFGDEARVRLAAADEINGKIDFQFLTHKGKALPKPASSRARSGASRSRRRGGGGTGAGAGERPRGKSGLRGGRRRSRR